jgi:hypothetical protein
MPTVTRAALSARARGALSARARGALCAVLLCLWACPRNPQSDASGSGGSAGSASDSDDPPADSEKRLDQLSRSELQSYCQDLNEELSTRFDNRRLAAYACTRMYIQQGDTVSCNQSTTACLIGSTQASLAAARPPDYQLNNDECAAIGGCRLALGVFDTCIGDRFDQSDQLMAQVNCSLANDPQAVDRLLQEIDFGRRVPQSCAAVAANCPGLL